MQWYDADECNVPASLVLDKIERGESLTVHVAVDETAWNPASTKWPIFGPCDVRYSGDKAGITATII